jgi:hypothetical protein
VYACEAICKFPRGAQEIHGKGKEKSAASSGPSLDDGWLASKFTKSDIQSLVNECILQLRETIKWRSMLGQTHPFEETNEIVQATHPE